MFLLILFDVAPDPVRSGIGLAAVLLVVALVILLVGAAALIFFLWCRKRSKRNQEMIRRADSPN